MFRKMKKAEVPKIQRLVFGFWKRRMDVADFKEMIYEEIAAMFTKKRHGVPFEPIFYLAVRDDEILCVAGVLKDTDDFYQIAYLTTNKRDDLWHWFEERITNTIWKPVVKYLRKQGKENVAQKDLPKIEFRNSPPWFYA